MILLCNYKTVDVLDADPKFKLRILSCQLCEPPLIFSGR